VGNYHNCTQGQRITALPLTGGFAEYTLTTEEKAYKLPDNVSTEDAALLDGVAVGVHAVHLSGVGMKDDTAVFGAGTIGLSLAALLKDVARTTYLVAKHPHQKKIGESLGVTGVIDAKGDTAKELVELTGGLGLDYAFEAVGGGGDTIQQALASVGACGTAVALGHFQSPVEIDSFRMVAREKTLMGVHAYALWKSDTEFSIALDAMASGSFDLNPLITHRYPLDKIDDAFRFATGEGRGKVIKVMLEI
jgi:threonine dehydrogenase-like Zn-dependent dehydrogenase